MNNIFLTQPRLCCLITSDFKILQILTRNEVICPSCECVMVVNNLEAVLEKKIISMAEYEMFQRMIDLFFSL